MLIDFRLGALLDLLNQVPEVVRFGLYCINSANEDDCAIHLLLEVVNLTSDSAKVLFDSIDLVPSLQVFVNKKFLVLLHSGINFFERLCYFLFILIEKTFELVELKSEGITQSFSLRSSIQ